ncbi:MAG: Holliday junction resolvase RuvX [Omnitrophica bacterium]|nr:Holliday junction resolvase RuvX [Candidatus Omnitrophota bacterium]
MRILALDLGEKNIGLAISDKLGWTAQGLPTLRRQAQDKDICAIADIAKENCVTEIVVGMPINMNGTLGKSAQAVAAFLEDLKKKVTLPIKVWDERLTSLQAEKVLLEQDLSRKKRKHKIDRLAAQLILQNYLDSKTNP